MWCRQTFILAYVLERECEAGVLALDDADLAKGALADDAQQAEVVEVHWDERARLASMPDGSRGRGVGGRHLDR